ncbi:jouberin-like [Aphidius gifuensis]|uniref:jouberin-like n=1 Tax=Aphidius gifuensis TaxID=684658 RepID=UPI001CDCCD1B|nr:jouberin-like [Aphidius gifuensis]
MFKLFDRKSDEVKEKINDDHTGVSFTSKMGKLFRSLTKNSNLSQSRQQLNSEIEEIDVESQNYIDHRKSLETKIDEEIDVKIDDDIEIKSAAKKIRKLRKTDNVKSSEMDIVVVDVHRENIGDNNNDESDEKIIETVENIDEYKNDKQVILSPHDISIDSVKKQRKRWSKTSIVMPPKRSSILSNDSVKKSPIKNNFSGTKPIAAPRNNKEINLDKLHDDYGVGNEGFEYDDDNDDDRDEDEQILTIETETGKTKIEISSMKNTTELSDNSFKNISDNSDNENIMIMTPKESINFSNDDIIDLENSDSSLSSKKTKIQTYKMKKLINTSKKSSSSLNSGKSFQSDDTKSLSDVKKFSRAQISSTDDEKYKSKKKKLHKNISKIETSSSKDSTDNKKLTIKKKKKRKLKQNNNDDVEKFISIIIHRADMIEVDYVTRHPMVIVHIVDIKTGNYLKKNDDKNIKEFYLQPLITAIFDFKENKTMVPHWNEELIFEHNFNDIMEPENNQVIILFEIVDLLNSSEISQAHDQYGGENCWYKIAWAFLKPCGNSGKRHIDKQVRLQLYRPKRVAKKIPRNKCEAYSWWKTGSRDKYPSTIYVTVSSVDPPKLEPILYSQMDLSDVINSPVESSLPSNINQQETINISRWTRLAAQSCKIPNEHYFQTETTENGCFYVVFSNNGKYLACANSEEYNYPIIIYNMEDGKIIIKFNGHKSFIYSLDWSPDDNIILSVSSDQTARLWDIKSRLIQEINMLPHPSYVYCGKFDPINPTRIATGCYDNVIRIWKYNNNKSHDLIQELENHEGFVNSICFKNDGTLLSADSVGIIIQWVSKKNKKTHTNDFLISKKIKIREINNIVINEIFLHPLGSRLFVHTRDSNLRMLDLSTGVVLKKYDGFKNFKIQTTSRVSPCGGLLLCGDEDGILNIWNIESGKKIAYYHTEPKSLPISCVDYHPYDHVMVYSTFGGSSSAMILRYEKNSNGKNTGLKLLNDEDNIYPDSWRDELLDCETKNEVKSRRSSLASSRWRGEVTTRQEPEQDRQNLKLRMKIFNDANEPLKTKSANRLTSIIAKIDRILSNNSTAKLSYDIEANRFNKSIETISKFVDKGQQFDDKYSRFVDDEESNILTPYVPPLFSTFEGNSVNSTSDSRTEIIEMKNLERIKHTNKKGKSKSAREKILINDYYQDDEREINFSDGIVQMKNKKKLTDNNFSKKTLLTRVEGKKNLTRESRSNSAGTYIVDVDDDDKKNIDESDDSIKSNVTFVIENEKAKKPVPKPRRIK